MGTYVPSGPRRQRSIDEALLEAEEDHFLDCPTADIWLRTSAILLDLILCTILFTGIKHSCAALGIYIVSWLGDPSPSPAAPAFTDPEVLINYVIHVLQYSLLYLYGVWSVSRYGGTPAKLMLGMRVVDVGTGRRLGLARAMLREIVGKAAGIATLGFGFGLPLVRDDKRALHDLMTGSVVKRVHGAP